MAELIRPVLKDQALLADVDAWNGKPGLRIWWLGQSGYLLQHGKSHALLDPYLSDSLTKKYADTDKPHVRMTERAVDPAQLNFIDVVSTSHNHTDHLDGETLQPLCAANPGLKLVIPEANRAFVAERVGVDPALPLGVDDGSHVEAAGFTFHGIAAAHNALEQDAEGRHHFLGYVITFGPYALYHSGDTLLYEGLVERLTSFHLDLAMLPINGHLPERRVAGNLWGREAAWLAKMSGARMVFPCHYNMFEFNTETTEEFEGECQRLEQPFKVLQCGERWEAPA